MKIVVIHGEDNVKSRNRLEEVLTRVKYKGYDLIKVAGKKVNLTETTRAQSLFGQKQLFVLDEPDVADFGEFIKDQGEISDASIIAYFGKEVGRLTLKYLPKGAKVEKFDIPHKLWAFLDSFYPGNGQASLRILHEALVGNPIEMILALLARHVRDLYWVASEPKTFSSPPWRVSKLKRQADKFSKKHQQKVTAFLAQADFKSKTGQADLLTSLDLLIIKELE